MEGSSPISVWSSLRSSSTLSLAVTRLAISCVRRSLAFCPISPDRLQGELRVRTSHPCSIERKHTRENVTFLTPSLAGIEMDVAGNCRSIPIVRRKRIFAACAPETGGRPPCRTEADSPLIGNRCPHLALNAVRQLLNQFSFPDLQD